MTFGVCIWETPFSILSSVDQCVVVKRLRSELLAWERVTLFGGVRETHSPNSVSCKQQEQGRCKNCSCNFRDRRPPITSTTQRFGEWGL
ncbi:hypothetical protein TNCV_2127521 [Trichonephila clavipes]|nr:hypothetical protein TNCV_2127521 [Trichonephila clavipes]